MLFLLVFFFVFVAFYFDIIMNILVVKQVMTWLCSLFNQTAKKIDEKAIQFTMDSAYCRWFLIFFFYYIFGWLYSTAELEWNKRPLKSIYDEVFYYPKSCDLCFDIYQCSMFNVYECMCICSEWGVHALPFAIG